MRFRPEFMSERWAVSIDVRYGSQADMCSALGDVRFVPIADTVPTLLDNLIGALLERQGHIEGERLRSLEVDHKLELSGLQYW